MDLAKIKKYKKKRKEILSHLDALKSFPKTKTVRLLRKELEQNLALIEKKITKEQININRGKKIKEVKEKEKTKEIKQHQANESRSSKLRKYHNYLRQVRNNYPEVSYANLRKMFKLRKQGREVEVPDVVWQNPSP